MLVSKYSYDHTVHAGFDNSMDPSLTMQEFAAESDINHIVQMYEAGVVPSSPASVAKESNVKPFYGDFADAPSDLMTYYDKIHDLTSRFDSLPLEIKEACNYDPRRFIEICRDPSYSDLLVQHGLATPKANSSQQDTGEGASESDA